MRIGKIAYPIIIVVYSFSFWKEYSSPFQEVIRSKKIGLLLCNDREERLKPLLKNKTHISTYHSSNGVLIGIKSIIICNLTKKWQMVLKDQQKGKDVFYVGGLGPPVTTLVEYLVALATIQIREATTMDFGVSDFLNPLSFIPFILIGRNLFLFYVSYPVSEKN